VEEERIVRVGNALRRVGAGALSRALAPADNIRITLSHYVETRHLANFERLVTQLLRDREAIAPNDLVRCYTDGKQIPGKLLMLTFDDGLLSSFEAARKVLTPLGLRAMFFVPTKILSLRTKDEMREFYAANVYRRRSAAMPEERYVAMTVDHLRELHAQGHMVLPHTHSHIALSEMKGAALVDRELRAPKLMLEDLLQAPADSFAFPIGNESVVESLAYDRIKELYSLCFTGLNGLNAQGTDRYFLYRDCIHPHYTSRHVSNISAGSYDLYYALRMRRLRRRATAGDAG
jgi:peptidoglycan/xylan/chitin deacetylase (PgdA/CDA1 family)